MTPSVLSPFPASCPPLRDAHERTGVSMQSSIVDVLTRAENSLISPKTPEDIRKAIFAFQEIMHTVPGAFFGDTLPLVHHFAHKLYARELQIPQGCLWIGKLHKYSHARFLLKGAILVVTESAGVQHQQAPYYMITEAGTKRVGLALTDVIIVTVHATDKTQLNDIEEDIIVPDAHAQQFLEQITTILHNRADYQAVLAEHIVWHEHDHTTSTAEDDSLLMTDDDVRIGPSPIEGVGVFALRPFHIGEAVACARIESKRTVIGRYVNHAQQPNCVPRLVQSSIILLACCPIDIEQEITMDYRDVRTAALQLNAQLRAQGGSIV